MAHVLVLVPARTWHGRPARLALRLLVAAFLAGIAARSGAGAPAAAGVITGLVIWTVLSGRGDLAPPPGR